MRLGARRKPRLDRRGLRRILEHNNLGLFDIADADTSLPKRMDVAACLEGHVLGKDDVRSVGKAGVAVSLMQGVPPLGELRLEREHLAVFRDGNDIGFAALVEELGVRPDNPPRRGRFETRHEVVDERSLAFIDGRTRPYRHKCHGDPSLLNCTSRTIDSLYGSKMLLQFPIQRGSVRPGLRKGPQHSILHLQRVLLQLLIHQLARHADVAPRRLQELMPERAARRRGTIGLERRSLIGERRHDLNISTDAFTLLKDLAAAGETMKQKELSVETKGERSELLGGIVHMAFNRLDLTELGDQGYVRITSDIGTLCRASVTHRGQQLVEQHIGMPTLVAERQLRITLKRVSGRAPHVAASLKRAFHLALHAETQEQISEVGHNCRLAFQDALDYLYGDAGPGSEAKTSTKKRLEALIERIRPSDTDRKMLRSLESACAAASLAFERGEHRSERDERPLDHEDAVDMVLLTSVAVSQAFRWF